MALVEDTRQKRGKHDAKAAYFADTGEDVVRCALPVGDYQRPAKVAVDTKKDVQELAQDMWQDHERFARECDKAKSLGTQLVILVENTHGLTSLNDLERWVEPSDSFNKRNRTGHARRIDGAKLSKACRSMNRGYGVKFAFCAPEESGEKVIRLLDMFGGGQ